MYCKYCGTELDNEVVVCIKCGKQVQDLKVSPSATATQINQLALDKNAWYFETWFIVLMFLFFFPIGIILLILKNK